MATQNLSSVALPSNIEVFKAGDHITDAGIPITFTEADIAGIAARYNTALHEAPITAGHPEHDKPAYGWVKGMLANGSTLLMGAGDVEPQFAEMVRTGRFKKRSVKFYAPQDPSNPTPGQWYLRHIAFLGAAPPAVKGLKDIQFDENSSGVSFTESINSTPFKEKIMPDPTTTTAAPDAAAQARTQARITELEKQNAELSAAFEKEKAGRIAAEEKLTAIEKAKEEQQSEQIVQFAEGLVKAGKLLPKDKAMEIAIMKDMAKAAPVQFSEGNTTRTENKLQAYMKRLSGSNTVVQFGEFAGASIAVEEAKPATTDEELDKKVQAYMAAHPGTVYLDALKAVQAGGQ